MLLAWYDRDVAATLFEPIRAKMEHTGDHELASGGLEFLAWSIFDPRAAAARLEQVPINPKLDLSAELTRQRVVETLGLAHEARWRFTWLNFSEMADLLLPDEID
jgi:hypothetical protein